MFSLLNDKVISSLYLKRLRFRKQLKTWVRLLKIVPSINLFGFLRATLRVYFLSQISVHLLSPVEPSFAEKLILEQCQILRRCWFRYSSKFFPTSKFSNGKNYCSFSANHLLDNINVLRGIGVEHLCWLRTESYDTIAQYCKSRL